jgi:hypothetical protein
MPLHQAERKDAYIKYWLKIKKLKYLCKAHEFLLLGSLKQLLKQFLYA